MESGGGSDETTVCCRVGRMIIGLEGSGCSWIEGVSTEWWWCVGVLVVVAYTEYGVLHGTIIEKRNLG